jgi:hypothetical protein
VNRATQPLDQQPTRAVQTTIQFPEQMLFFATGRRHGEGVDAIDGLSLRPALLARYRDLTRMRHDFPLVLVDSGPAAGEVRSLTSIVDGVLRDVAPRGLEGERLRRRVLGLERGIRTRCAAGERSTLRELWQRAAAALAAPGDEAEEGVLEHVAGKLGVDGRVVDCDQTMPAMLVTHLWQAAQERKRRAFQSASERLTVRLADILRAAFIHSAAGQQPENLRSALGGPHRDAFDFAVMSRLVGRNVPKDELPQARRARIEWALRTLGGQRFFPASSNPPDAAHVPASFEFQYDNCAAAAAAFRARLPEVAQVVKAMSIAELEVDGKYIEAEHDPFFEPFDETVLSAEDVAMFPDYLVSIAAGRSDAPENAGLMEMLSAGLPVKVLTETVDLLEEATVGTGHFAFGVRSARLANTATALGGVFVVQAASSNLYALRHRLESALAHRGAALVSVYAGGTPSANELPQYLAAAAAMESRAFPAFTYDPYAGDNQAARFTLEDNPQPEADWPIAPLDYADKRWQRVSEETPFTVADFVLGDRRYAAHFARVPRHRWHAAMLPADEWLALDSKAAGNAVPYVLAVGPDDVLHRVIVDSRLMQTVARCRTFWHRLQEQGGIHNSHAAILVAREQAKWEQAKADEIAQLTGAVAAAASAPANAPHPEPAAAEGASAVVGAATAGVPGPARDPDEAWIETARCPSCNECQLINDRMFKYDANKQAYIADIHAGTFRHLVEAAEVCQVSIIHPGKPRDPNEPDLPDLLRRAEAFR